MGKVIQVSQVSKFFSKKQVLANISFDVSENTIHGFLGPNGAGKSTTIKIICGLLSLDGGKYYLGEKESDKFFSNQRLGYLSDNLPLYSDMLVRDYFKFILELKKLKSYGSFFEELYKNFRISEINDLRIDSLSKGNKQKVAIMQAFIGNPELVILDEPTAGLDPEHIQVFRDMLRSFSRSLTIFLSSHLLSEIQRICDGLTIINEGKILFTGSMNCFENLKLSSEKLILRFEESLNFKDFQKKIAMKCSLVDETENKFVLEFFDDCNKREVTESIIDNFKNVFSINWQVASLEDNYLELIRRVE